MVRWVVRLTTHSEPIELLSFFPQPDLYDWCKKNRLCYIDCEMVHIKDPLLLIVKSSP